MFTNLPSELKKIKGLNEKEKDYLVHLVDSRFDFLYGDAHGVAYILDPR
jgi:hypothetical protein